MSKISMTIKTSLEWYSKGMANWAEGVPNIRGRRRGGSGYGGFAGSGARFGEEPYGGADYRGVYGGHDAPRYVGE
jgi:hypothetical protein